VQDRLTENPHGLKMIQEGINEINGMNRQGNIKGRDNFAAGGEPGKNPHSFPDWYGYLNMGYLQSGKIPENIDSTVRQPLLPIDAYLQILKIKRKIDEH